MSISGTCVTVNSQEGFTLVEIMVAMAITVLLATGLASVINQITRVSQQQRKLSDVQNNLYFAMNDMVDDIRQVARQSQTWDTTARFRFIGRDNDGTFENSDLTDNRINQTSDADTLFFHALTKDEEVTTDRADRETIGFFLTAEETNLYDGDAWRLVRYSRKYKESDFNDDRLMPPMEIQYTEGDQSTISIYVDRLSFRYMDDSGNWHNAWDSHDLSLSQVNFKGDLPSAVEVAIRGYSPSPDSRSDVDPKWYTTMVSLEATD